MNSASDITNLFARPVTDEMGFRQGTVVSFDETTGENVINVGGTELINVPLLRPIVLDPPTGGEIVALLRSKTNYFILGRIMTPPY